MTDTVTETESESRADGYTFPTQRTCPFSPPPEYRRMRAEGPLVQATLWNGDRTWLVTHQKEARELLLDERLSVEPHRLAPLAPGEENAAEGFRAFVGMDAPEHGVYRRMVTTDFTVKRVRQMRPELQRTAEALVEEMAAAGGTVDLVEAFAMPLATTVICELLGAPYADRDFFHSRSSVAVLSSTPEEIEKAYTDLTVYLDGLVTAKEAEPDDALISRLVTEQLKPGNMTRMELLNTALLLLIVGHETSANMIGLGALTLMREPQVRRRLAEDPALMGRTVDELLRFHSSGDWLRRAAKEDIEIAGRRIRAGESVIVLAAAANHDENWYERPEVFDIDREERRNIALGFGAHQCIGQHLARAELEIAFTALFSRLPDLAPAVDVEELPFKRDATLFGLRALPVTF